MANNYPPYPGSNWDYACKETARMALRKPNKKICIYCHGQCKADEKIPHKPDCPARNEKDD